MRYVPKHRAESDSGRRGRRVAAASALTAAVAVPLIGAPAQAASGDTWNQLAQCESGGNWSINTGNGYYGGLQFSPSTWTGFGGGVYASSAQYATREQQIAIAEKVLNGQGWGAWPACSAALGLTTADAQEAPSVSTPAPVQRVHRHRSVAPQTSSSSSSSSSPSTSSSTSSSTGGGYVVQSGDTLSLIARAQGVSGGWRALYDANRGVVSDPNLIYPGQQLVLS